ncbi:hypothetical protein PspLS_01533 [Pyricularia sp. CBS 133598]|nr:hypothetical protein PspLS_01533 [Pyricularia sp. CBS 133598]
MSGLEPLAALGLAYNILQLVEAGDKIFSIVKTAYKEGSFDQKTAKEYTTVLCQLSGEIRSKSDCEPTKPDPFESELLKTAKTCHDNSRDLLGVLASLDSLASKGELLATIKLKFKVVWRRGRLKRLELSLKDVESRMQKSILGRVFEIANEHTGQLQEMDEAVQHMCNQYMAGHRETSDLVTSGFLQTQAHIDKANQQIRLHMTKESKCATELITTAISSVQITGLVIQQQQAARDKLLSSLRFESMNARRNHIRGSHPKSFSCIFSEDEQRKPDQVIWDDFSEWLRSDEAFTGSVGSPALERAERNVELSCAGLLEPSSLASQDSVVAGSTFSSCELRSQLQSLLQDDRCFKLAHRSVYDFLKSTDIGKVLLEEHQVALFDAEERRLEAYQGLFRLFDPRSGFRCSLDVNALIWWPREVTGEPDSADHQRRKEEYRLKAAAVGLDYRLLDPKLHRLSHLLRLMLAAIRPGHLKSFAYARGLLPRLLKLGLDPSARALDFGYHHRISKKIYISSFEKQWFNLETPFALTIGALYEHLPRPDALNHLHNLAKAPAAVCEILDLAIILLENGASLNSNILMTLNQTIFAIWQKETYHSSNTLGPAEISMRIQSSPEAMMVGLMAAFSVTTKTLLRYVLQHLRDLELPVESLVIVEKLEALVAKEPWKNNNNNDLDIDTQPLMFISEFKHKDGDWSHARMRQQQRYKEVKRAKRQRGLQKHLLETQFLSKMEDRDEAMRKVRQLLKRIFSESDSTKLFTGPEVRRRVRSCVYICKGFKGVFDEDPALSIGHRKTRGILVDAFVALQ